MEEEDLRHLIERLQQLHIQRENISAEERHILQTIHHPLLLGNNTDQSAPRAVIVDEVVATTTASVVPVFRVGQPVYITNRITHTGIVRRATNADRAAIVTHFTSTGRVGIRTFNGYNTNRQPTNLRPLTPEEVISFESERRRLSNE
jgi:hypothetical protein